MDLNEELEEIQNIIDTLECLKNEIEDEGRKDIIYDTLVGFYAEYNELYETINKQNEKELAEMNYAFEINRI